MGKVIVCAAFKGGVGKTTSATNIAGALSKLGYKVALWDCDFQANATMGFGFNPEKTVGNSLYEVIHKEKTLNDVILKTPQGILVIPSSDDLSAFDLDVFQDADGKFPRATVPFILRDMIDEIRDEVDFHIVDTGPSLSLLTVNTMVAADMFLVATQLGRFGIWGTQRYVARVVENRQQYIPDEPLDIKLFATFFNRAKSISSVANQELRRWAGTMKDVTLTDTTIPDRATYENAQAYRGLPATLVDSERDEAVRAYFDLVKEAIL